MKLSIPLLFYIFQIVLFWSGNSLAGPSDSTQMEVRVESESDTNYSGMTPKQIYERALLYYVETNVPASLRWTIKAAELGYEDSQFMLSWFYFNGYGVPSNSIASLFWLQQCTTNNGACSFWSKVNLGWRYYTGCGTPVNYAEASKWFQQLQDQDEENVLPIAHFVVGLTNYAQGNYETALRQLQIALSDRTIIKGTDRFCLNNEQTGTAQDKIGLCYFLGRGVAINPQKATKWFKESANLGNAEAQGFLGFCYEKGFGVPMSYVFAYKWYNLAATQFNPQGILGRDGLKSVMQRSEIAEAERLSVEFTPTSTP